MRLSLRIALFACTLVLCAAAAPPAHATRPWMNASLPVDTRVALLLAQMTLAEKLRMLHGAQSDAPYDGVVPGIPRLGIPPLHLKDGPAGVRMPGTTALPAPLAMAATWDRSMAARYGAVIARDDRAKGVDVDLGPMVNIVRTAQAGRNFESLGEDPYLAAALVAPEVAAIERAHVIATTKHYAANNQENGRLRDSSNLDMRTFHEIYLPAFESAVRAGTGAVMCSYNRINGVWACENPQTLRVLEHDTGFRGFVMSDWGATHSTAAAANAGLDMQMPDDSYFGEPLAQAVRSGAVSKATIDDHVRRILHAMFAAGLFEHPPRSGRVPQAADRRDTLQIAEQGAVLLKNTGGLLPLDARSVRSIALIGGDMDADDRGGSAWVQGTGTIGPLDAIRAAAGPSVHVQYAWAQGVPFISNLWTADSLTLAPPDAKTGEHGLRAEFYDNDAFAGTPVVTRVDDAVDINPQEGPPLPQVGAGYSVRWSGTFTPPATGMYTLGIESRGGTRMSFDGAGVADHWKLGYEITTQTFRRSLVAGRRYPISVELHHGANDGWTMVRLVWRPPSGMQTPDIARAAKLAKASDIAIVFAGEFRTEQYDRPTTALTGGQAELIRAVARANPRTIVVLNNGGPVAMGSWARSVRAILDMWYPGEENGTALAALLFGNVDPSGRLPVSFPTNENDVPARVTWPAAPYTGPARDVNYTEGLDIGYRWYDSTHTAPLFPFGFGLSYTTFAYSSLRVRRVGVGDAIATVGVKNTGKRSGADVVELYLEYPKNASEPPKELRGFRKVFLHPGQRMRLSFHLQPKDFSVWNEHTKRWQIVPGTYRIQIGSSSRNIALTSALRT